MVHTEADMIVNQLILHHMNLHYVNHHHINRGYVNLHHDNNLLILNFHGDHNGRHHIDDPAEQDVSFIDKYVNNGRRGRFSNSIRDKRGGYSNPDEFKILFYENIDIESSFLWIDEVDKLFDIMYIPMKNHVKFVAYKLKGKAAL